MSGQTLSITIPKQLVRKLEGEAKRKGISRSRQIGGILLEWQDQVLPVLEHNRVKE